MDYILNNLNQIVESSTDGWKTRTTYTYDGRGNLAEKAYGKNKKVTTTAEYVFDETNKLVLGYNALRESSAYTYNGLGALVENTWVIAKNGYGYHDVSAIAEDGELLEPDASLSPEPEIETAAANNGKGNGNNGNGNSSGNNGQGNGNAAGNGDGNGSINKTSTVVKQFVVDYNTETFEPLVEHEVNGLDYKYVYGNDRLSVDISPINNSGHIVENGDHVRLYYHMDYLGTADYLTSPVSGKVEAWTHYNEWGLITHNAVLKCGQRELDLVKRYATHDYDSVLELYYAKARFYDAHDRRFTAVDPEKGEITTPLTLVQYIYAIDCPLVYIDVVGEKAKLIHDSSTKNNPATFAEKTSALKQSAIKTTVQKLTKTFTPQLPKPAVPQKAAATQKNKTAYSPAKATTAERTMKALLSQKQNAISSVKQPSKIQSQRNKEFVPQKVKDYQEKMLCGHYYGPVQSYMIQMTDSAFVALVELPDDIINGLSANANKWSHNIGTSFNNGDLGGVIYSSVNYVTAGAVDGFITGTNERGHEAFQNPTPYTISNYLLLGIPETFGRALNPKAYGIEPNSVKHWKAFYGALVTEGALMGAANAINAHGTDLHSTTGLQQISGQPENVAASQAAMDAVHLRNTILEKVSLSQEAINLVEQSGMSWNHYEDILAGSIHNSSASQVMLGKYDGGGPTSYVTRAGTDYTYFSIDTWNSIEDMYHLNDDQMFTLFNEPFLEIQMGAGKTFVFSHNPIGDTKSLGQELEYLTNHGYAYNSITRTAYPK